MSHNIERKDIDDFGKRNSNKDSYKNNVFDGKRKVKDEYTGETIFYSSEGVNSLKNERHFTTKTTSNVDHVVPIDQIIKKYGDKISPEQLKRITNSEYNLAITSEKLNKSKSNMSNHEYLYKQFKNGEYENIKTTYNMMKKEVIANTEIKKDIALIKIENIKTEELTKLSNNIEKVTNAGKTAALMGLTVSSINNIVSLANGEKELDKALIDIAKDGASSFVGTVGIEMTQGAIVAISKEIGNTQITNILSQQLPIAEISTMIMVGHSVIRFIKDEITAEECVTEIVLSGVGVLSYQLGMAAGGPVGAIIASAVVAQMSKAVIEYMQYQKINKEKEAQINNLVKEALVEMGKQRMKLEKMIHEEFERWDKAFDNGYKQIFNSIIDNDVEGIAIGLDSILNVFNQNCKFKTIDEFNNFFDDENAVLRL